MVDMNDPEVIESLKYLIVSKEEKIATSALPYDGKKNVFVRDHKEGFVAAEIQSEDAKGMVTVKKANGESATVKKDDIEQMNPPKYEKCDDMADLTYLNDATVLHNLRARFTNWYIYTYSGLFCVTINPFKRLPIYTMKMVTFYRGKKKNEVPPHLYLVADSAYAAMMRDRENQSMLITGESGAGKTENTKKVIQYFAFVAAGVSGKKMTAEEANKPSLEDQIVSANPVMEAYGNAKTTRNNNSSRFGKFIRIHFSANYGIAGADIEAYLLEKSRITYQMPAERNYHIFYYLCSKAFPDMVTNTLFLEHDPGKYNFINQGMLTIDKVDDCAEMKDTKKAFEILLFTEESQIDLFKITAACMHWGNQQWKQKPREEQAESDGTEHVEKVAKLLGLELDPFVNGLLKPRIKVGKEFVNKGQNQAQVTNACAALSKAMYARSFMWIVDKCNETLDVKTVKRAYFIGVLDIAGFETFEENGFEQLCINFTNERLQQYFNNFMFVLEQEEYAKEGIVWEMMSFGADLQATIDLIDKPMGIFSMLEEECVVPKGTDMTYKDKMYAKHLGKHPSFGKPKPSKSKYEAHFELKHYAGIVAYGVNGWLEKNKDPINEFVAAMFKAQQQNQLLSFLFREIGVEVAASGGKKGSQTISANHREQLNKLMKTLGATHPHFVRCIIPNEIKTGGIIDAHLVMHQLHCNGVLEGIRICRKGFPSRILYLEFIQRYSILNPDASKTVTDANTAKKATATILEGVKMDPELYRIGLTKVLFKAGVLGTLEEYRDNAISVILTMLQSQVRTYLMRKNIQKMIDQKKAISALQRNVKAYNSLKTWQWWTLMTFVKPLLQGAKKEEERKAREAEEARLAAEKAAKEAEEAAKAADQARRVEEERQKKIANEMQSLKDSISNAEQQASKLAAQKADLESQVRELEDKISASESAAGDLGSKKKKLEAEINDLKQNCQDITTKLHKAEADNKSKESQIRKMQDEMASQDDSNGKLLREKKRLEELNSKTVEQLQQEEDKVNHLNKIKSKLEQNLDEAEENLEREKKGRADLDKVKRRLESELKSSQAQIEEIEKVKRDVEDALKRKEAEFSNTLAKVEEEHAQATFAQKKLKELQQHLVEAEEATENERQARAKAEKQRADLSRELDELNERLEEAGGATNAQLDLNKKREAELAKLRRDLEEANVQHEATAAQLRKKHQDAVAEMSQQIDQLQKSKIKLEKEKQLVKTEVDEAKSQTEVVSKAKANSDRLAKQLEVQLQELNLKLEESGRQNNDLNSQKSRLQAENSNILSQLEESENRVLGFAKVRQQLQSQIEEAKRAAEEETRAKSSITQQYRNLLVDLESSKSQTEEEHNARVELQKQLAKVSTELQQYRSKYESEGIARAEELEEAKRKLASKLAEAEEQVEQALAKCSSLEKNKLRLQNEIEDLMVDVEKANSNASALEKKQKQFDKLIAEWKQKCESITSELESSQKEARQYSTEMFKLKSQYQESQETIESMHRENRNLADEIKDLMDQLGNGGKSVHEMQKNIKRVEAEKVELQKALEEAESLLQQHESKLLNAQLEVANARAEVERKLQAKEEEFENTRRNHARSIESIQATLEVEVKSKNEAIRQKKKLETDVNEIEIALDHANRNSVELQKANKKLQQTISELQSQIEDEQKQRSDARELAVAAERRANQLLTELEESRAGLEQAEKSRKAIETELHDAADRNSELSSQNSSLNGYKRKLENDLTTLRADLDEAHNELKNSEERFKKSLNDSARLADELRTEQDHAANILKSKKILDQQILDLNVRIEQAEANASKSAKRNIQKLEQHIHELEAERDAEQLRTQEVLKELRKNESSYKDLSAQNEQDKRSIIRLQELIDTLQTKLKVYKKQIESTEELAAINLAKYRKAQHELADAAERADQAENQIAKSRATSRGLSVRRGSVSRAATPQ